MTAKFKDLPRHHLVPRISEAELNEHIARIGHDIAKDYAGVDVTFLTVLWGARQFNKLTSNAIKLEPRKPRSIRQDVIRVESYGARKESSGDPRIVLWPKNPEENFRGKDVLIQDDIGDTKLTLARTVIPYVLAFKPNSIAVATMLTKSSHFDSSAADVKIKYSGPDIDFFALGTGLDFDQFYRELRGIWELVWDEN